METKHAKFEPRLTVGRAADYLGVHVETLRRWEAQGIVKAERTAGGHRRFPLSALRALRSSSMASAE